MKKIISFGLAMLVSVLFSSCGGSKSADTVSNYLKAEADCNYEAAYDLLSDSDKKAKSMEQFKKEESSEFGLFFTEAVRKSSVFKIIDSAESGNEAVINVEITQDDYSSLAAGMLGAAFTGDLAKKLRKYKENAQKKTITKTFNLIRENNQWRVFFNWEKEAKMKELTEKADSLKKDGKFEAALEIYNEIIKLDSLNENALQNIKEINKEIKKLQEKREYMKKISIYDFSAKYYESFLEGKVPGIVFKVKNNGDRELSLIEVTIYFKDEANVVIYESKFRPINKNGFWDNSTLKPNHIWQPERNTFYKSTSVPSEWQEGNADIEITDIEFEQ